MSFFNDTPKPPTLELDDLAQEYADLHDAHPYIPVDAERAIMLAEDLYLETVSPRRYPAAGGLFEIFFVDYLLDRQLGAVEDLDIGELEALIGTALMQGTRHDIDRITPTAKDELPWIGEGDSCPPVQLPDCNRPPGTYTRCDRDLVPLVRWRALQLDPKLAHKMRDRYRAAESLFR